MILWFEPERVTAGSWLFEHHPEWLIGPDGKDKLLFLGNREAREWLIAHVSRLIDEQKIDVYRQDFNFEPLPRWRTLDTPDRVGIAEIQHVTGYLEYFDALRKRFPNLMIDTCASGGRRLDLETLRRAVPLWRSDFPYEPSAMQMQTYGLSLWVPYFGTAINSLDPYYFRSQMTPATGLGFDPDRIDNGRELLRKLVAQWREVSPFYYGDFTPLTPFSTEDSAWMAWQFGQQDGRAGMIQAFRRQNSPFNAARFKLRGLDAAARYAVRDLDSGAVSEYTGRELLEKGLPVSITAAPGSLLLVYERQ
jgi:alpha-galactosidase